MIFKSEIKKAGCEIIKHLGNLPEISDEMSDLEKQKIINNVFEKLYSKNHLVRINLEKMKNKVEEVKIIEESLR